ncbi:MAG: GAF domain-containing protein [Bacteroidota bacterium]
MSRIKVFKEIEVYKNTELPFSTHISFEKMFEYWNLLAKEGNPGEVAQAKAVLKKLKPAKELHQPFEDIQLLWKYEEEISLLLSPLFPTMLTNNEIKSCTIPFMPVYFNPTDRFHNIMAVTDEEEYPFVMRGMNIDQAYIGACIFILNAAYNANIDFRKTYYFDVEDKSNGLKKHYRVMINGELINFTKEPHFKDVTREQIIKLLDNFGDIELWKATIPPNSFRFEGFMIMNLFDVTGEEALSALKQDLLERNALHSPEIIENIRTNLCSMLNIPDLVLGFAAFDSENSLLKSMGFSFWNSIVLGENNEKKCDTVFCNYSSQHLFLEKTSLAMPEVDESLRGENPLVDVLLKKNIRSYLAYPLKYNDKVIGVLELGSPRPCALHSVVAASLGDVGPLFTIAMQRTIDERETQLEAIIQEKFTAIHSSVAWRFFEAADNLLQKRHLYDAEDMEEISFVDVYPLYGQSDIKGSSTERNKAIQADLIAQLRLAKDVLNKAIAQNSLPIYDELKFRITRYINNMKDGLNAGDELNVLDFLKVEVDPVFHHLANMNMELRNHVKAYTDKLDPELGVLYDKRKDFEQSVTLLNEKISEFIEKKQDIAQEMFPHYFEKYQTDGVEYNMYIGQSLVKKKTFDPVFLRNLRLWQLMTTCEVENVIDRYRDHLKLPLQICSLILVHSNPMAIKFSMDEKQFDVDGAYNIRYEIVKKRIDKAYIKGTTERLTQPKKIAIVYSQNKEAQEYIKYLEYLQSINYIEEEIEWLELNDLQGATGLKALRVTIRYDIKAPVIEKGTASKLMQVAGRLTAG